MQCDPLFQQGWSRSVSSSNWLTNHVLVYGIDETSLSHSCALAGPLRCCFVDQLRVRRTSSVHSPITTPAPGPPPPFLGYYSSSAARGTPEPGWVCDGRAERAYGSQGNKANCQVVVQRRSDRKQLMRSFLLGHQINTKCETNWVIYACFSRY
jgi:hypothetical protein